MIGTRGNISYGNGYRYVREAHKIALGLYYLRKPVKARTTEEQQCVFDFASEYPMTKAEANQLTEFVTTFVGYYYVGRPESSDFRLNHVFYYQEMLTQQIVDNKRAEIKKWSNPFMKSAAKYVLAAFVNASLE